MNVCYNIMLDHSILLLKFLLLKFLLLGVESFEKGDKVEHVCIINADVADDDALQQSIHLAEHVRMNFVAMDDLAWVVPK